MKTKYEKKKKKIAAYCASFAPSGIFSSRTFSHVNPFSEVRPKWPIAAVSE